MASRELPHSPTQGEVRQTSMQADQARSHSMPINEMVGELSVSWRIISEKADCIILPGSWCADIDGMPTKDLKARCDYEFLAKKHIKKYTCTIVTGGSGRGVEGYLVRDPKATEAGQMKKYAVKMGEPASDYILEPLALETLGNVIFSTKILLKHGLKSPLFITQQHHAMQIDQMLDHWFGKSAIKPYFWIVPDVPGAQTSPNRLADGAMRALLSRSSDRPAGLAFIYRGFRSETVGLPPDSWESPTTKWAFEIAIRWLYKFHQGRRNYNELALSEDPELRKQYTLEVLLREFLEL